MSASPRQASLLVALLLAATLAPLSFAITAQAVADPVDDGVAALESQVRAQIDAVCVDVAGELPEGPLFEALALLCEILDPAVTLLMTEAAAARAAAGEAADGLESTLGETILDVLTAIEDAQTTADGLVVMVNDAAAGAGPAVADAVAEVQPLVDDVNDNATAAIENAPGTIADSLAGILALLDSLRAQLQDGANQTRDTVTDTVAPLVIEGTLTIDSPSQDDLVPADATLTITTDLPDSVAAPRFVIQWSPAGTTNWSTLGVESCEGTGLRSCELPFTHSLNENGGLRVVYANETACLVDLCAIVPGAVGFDSTPPVSAIGAGAADAATGIMTLPFTASDDRELDRVELFVSFDAGDFLLSSVAPVNDAFTVNPDQGSGNYAFYVVAHDAAGNAETKTVSELDFDVVVTYHATSTYSSEYLINGDVLTVTSCVGLGGEAADAATPVDITFRGETVGASFVSGCNWQASFAPVSGVANIESADVRVDVDTGDGVAAFTESVTLSPNRLVTLTSTASRNFVATGDSVQFTTRAIYPDTGAPANLVRVTITDGTLTQSGFTNSAGFFTPSFTSEADSASAFVTSADIETTSGNDAPISAADMTENVIWTGLTGPAAVPEHASFYNNVDEYFSLTYCVKFTYDNSDAEGVIVNVRHITSDEFFSGATDETGCVEVEVVNATVGVHDYETTFGLDAITSGIIESPSVTFTKVHLTLVPADVFVNVGDAPNFQVCGKFVHDDAFANGATVELRAANADVLETISLGVSGCANQTHIFADLFDQDVLAIVTATPEEVDLQEGEANTGRFVATRVVIGDITAPDTFVAYGDTVTYTVPVTYEHDLTNVVAADITLSNGGNFTCTASDGVASCDVVKSGAFNDTFAVSIETDEGIINIADAPVVTARTVWTRILAALSYDDGIVGVGDDITMTYTAIYEHDGSNVPTFTVDIADTCAAPFAETVDGADGVATVIINHDIVCNELVTAVIASSNDGVILQDPAVAETSADAVWTRVVLALTVPDTFTSTKEALAFTGTAVYEHDNSNVPSATISVVDSNSNIINTESISVVDGVFAGAAKQDGIYAGLIHFVASDVAEGVAVQLANNIEATWTDVILDSVVATPFVNVGDTVTITGTAVYAGDLGDVATGTISLLDSADDVLTTVSILDGVWTADVSMPSAYNDTLTVRLDAAENDVAGVPVLTDIVTWTRIALTMQAPDDVFVNVGDTITYTIGATYELINTPVTGSTLVATSAEGDELGRCEIVDGACDLELTTANDADGVYAGIANLDVTAADSGVVIETQNFATSAMTWTKLLVTYTNATGPFNTGSAANFVVTVKYAHDESLVEDALAIVDGFSIGEQTAFTDANGVATVPGYESAVGSRLLSVGAAQLAEGITAYDTQDGVTLRWTALGFSAYRYSVAPTGEQNGEPVFATNTPVTVCATVVDGASSTPVPGATVLMRGVTRTADSNGEVCYTIAASPSVRTVRVTSHGLSGVIEGVTITSSIDRTVNIRFA